MKKLSLSLATLLVLSGVAFANCGHCLKEGKMGDAKMGMGEETLSRLTKDLSLTQEQQTAVKAILDSQMAEKEALHKETMDKMMALHSNTMTKIEALLTPKQKERFTKNDTEMCPHGKEHSCCPKK
jgi:Spy/CpxP family protein refolding chaperone